MTTIDLAFQVRATNPLPADYGYELSSSLSHEFMAVRGVSHFNVDRVAERSSVQQSLVEQIRGDPCRTFPSHE